MVPDRRLYRGLAVWWSSGQVGSTAADSLAERLRGRGVHGGFGAWKRAIWWPQDDKGGASWTEDDER
jgi:hypothetical protein